MAEVEVNGIKVEKDAEEVSPKEAELTAPVDVKIEVKKEPEEADVNEAKLTTPVKVKIEVKKEPEEDVEASSLEKQIIRQIEYYFGDINLPRDKFLQEQIKLDDGWIPLEVMLKFQRLANLSMDVGEIVKALKKAKNDLIEVSEDKIKIRRNPERVLPQQTEERRKELTTRTVYCKGFPQGSTLDDLLEYFQDYGNVESIIMRYYHDKKTKTSHFKGSAFIVFPSREKAEEFLKEEGVKYGDTELLRLWQEDYLEKKRLERKIKPVKAGAEKQEEQEKEGKSFPKGSVMHLKGDFAKMTRDELKSALEEKGDKVAFINYNKGDEEGWVRMQEENAANTFFEKLETNMLMLKEASLEVRVLEGEEEDKFLKDAMNEMTKRRNASRQNFRGRRGGRGGRGGRGSFNQNRKRKADNAGDGPPAKQEAKA